MNLIDSPVVLSLLVSHDTINSSFQGSDGKGHHLIQDSERKLFVGHEEHG